MDNKRLVGGLVAAGLVALVLIGAYMLYSPEGTRKVPIMPQDDTYVAPATVVVHHTKNAQGAHVYSGAVPMSSTCNVVSSGISTDEEADAMRVSLALRILKSLDGSCEGVADGTTQTFYVSFTPQTDKPIKLGALSVNGQPIEYTVVEGQ